jgi:hypothetical protein
MLNSLFYYMTAKLRYDFLTLPLSSNDDDQKSLFILEVCDMLDRRCYRYQSMLNVITNNQGK